MKVTKTIIKELENIETSLGKVLRHKMDGYFEADLQRCFRTVHGVLGTMKSRLELQKVEIHGGE